MERLKVKKGNIYLYLGLLAAALMVMTLTRRAAHQRVPITATSYGDTIIVGIQISPIGVSAHGDTLDGFYYDMMRHMAATENLNIKIEGFTQTSTALNNLDNGVYDVVVAEMPAREEIHGRNMLADPVDPGCRELQSWSVTVNDRELLETLNRYISQFKDEAQYKHLTEKYFGK